MTSLAAVILAAGKGTRMNSDLPKVAHEVAGAPMVWWVAEACRAVGCERIVVIVGHRQEVVRGIFESEGESDGEAAIEFAVQDQQLGTGHAVRCAEPHLGSFAGDVLVLCGDGPLISPETLESLVRRHRSTGASATMATAVLADPSGYGRIVRDARGGFSAIVEEKNATAEQRAIREVNPSYYCFRAKDLFGALARVKRNGVSGEYYLTDVPSMLMAEGGRVEVIDSVPAGEVLSVNTPAQLAEVDRLLRARLGMMETEA
jgi:bifunctional UDP-N-acetylglucosamine pyrophosphorylase/glucosamine-1-phosphate N-acetyltransferase